MKILLYIFVETENVGKAINALSEGGISGFFLMEYRGLSPQDWKGFLIDENPEKAVKIINDISRNAVMIGTIVSEKKLTLIKKYIRERLGHDRHTILEVPINSVEVNIVD
ncbi:hypothetical protein KKP91_02095 [Methanothermococcus sp. SCGC AD-155-M21]|nr:hypothetical protein [Methanothermococcus sp. SCGC AD-155-M21]